MHLCLVLGCSLLSWRLLAVGRPQLLLLLPHIHLRLLAPIQLLQHLLHLLPLGLALLLDAHLLICCSSCLATALISAAMELLRPLPEHSPLTS